MKIFANRKIKLPFGNILFCILSFTLAAALFAGFEVRNAAIENYKTGRRYDCVRKIFGKCAQEAEPLLR